jgi:hypothetical protein
LLSDPATPGPHPDPPSDLANRRLPIAVIPAGTPWCRCHRSIHEALYFSRSRLGRFNAPGGEFGVLYVGADVSCAFIETLGQATGENVVTRSALSARTLTRVEARRPLRLVDLRGAGLARLGADGRLCTGDHANGQRWSRELWQHPALPDGLLYRARHDLDLSSTALFDRVANELDAFKIVDFIDYPLLHAILDYYGFELRDDTAPEPT